MARGSSRVRVTLQVPRTQPDSECRSYANLRSATRSNAPARTTSTGTTPALGMAAAAGPGGKARFTESRGFGSSKSRLNERKSSVDADISKARKSSLDGMDSKESKSVVKLLSKGSLQQEAENLLKNFDKNSSKDLDKEEFRRLLQELDENKRLPLPANFEWAWTNGDKDKNGVITKDELVYVISKYRAYLKAQPDILKLIEKHDTNSDHILDAEEMKRLLQSVAGSQRVVTSGDVDFVLREVKNVAKVVHGSYNPTLTSDPGILSKAITTWWLETETAPAASIFQFPGFAASSHPMQGSTHSLHSQAAPMGDRGAGSRRPSAHAPAHGSLPAKHEEELNLRFWEKEFWTGLWERTVTSCGCTMAAPRRELSRIRTESHSGVRTPLVSPRPMT